MRILVLLVACSLISAVCAAERKSSRSLPPPNNRLEPEYRSVPETFDSNMTAPADAGAMESALENKKVNPYQPFGSDQPLYGKRHDGDIR